MLPLVAVALSGRCTALYASMALTTPVLGFLIGTPFALANLPQFLDNVAFEVRHYAVLGHGPFTGEPGLSQARFYLSWMADTAAGNLATALAMVGAIVVLWRRGRTGGIFLLFPLLFGVLMANQKVNFTRNVLVLIPVVSVLALVTVEQITRWLSGRRWPPQLPRGTLVPLLVLVVSLEPLAHSVADRRDRVNAAPDSRVAASLWLTDNARPYVDTAIAGELQFPGHVYSARGVSRFPTDELDPATLFLAGFDRLVVGPDFDARSSAGLLFTERVFDGSTRLQLIVRSPQVTVYGLAEMLTESDAVRSRVAENGRFALTPPTFVGPVPSAPGDDWICDPPRAFAEPAGPSQDHCWTHSRITHLLVDSRAVQAVIGTAREIDVTLDIMSPWPSQSCSLALAEWASTNLCEGLQVRTWEQRTATLPSALLAGAQGLSLIARHVHSPASQGIGEDERRWGLAIRAVGLAGKDR